MDRHPNRTATVCRWGLREADSTPALELLHLWPEWSVEVRGTYDLRAKLRLALNPGSIGHDQPDSKDTDNVRDVSF